MQWARSLLNVLGRTRRLVGTDLHGNEYYETIRQGKKPKREMITKIEHMEYTPGLIPIEWEAWIRGKRELPPTHEELIAEQRRVKTLKERARQVEEKDRKQQVLEQKTSQIAAHVGHASAPLYESLDNRSQPTSTGTTFQPGEWIPESGPNDSPGSVSKGKETDETFEPESWVPPGNKPPVK